MRLLFFCLSIIGFIAPSDAQNMTLKKMDKIFRAEIDQVERDQGIWTLSHGGLPVMVVTDMLANRMRIFTPITAQRSLKDEELETMLEANFHSALDAKYALYKGFVVSLYNHPLRELQEEQLLDALDQVVILAKTFGTTYSSTDMIFGGEAEISTPKPKINESPSDTTRRS